MKKILTIAITLVVMLLLQVSVTAIHSIENFYSGEYSFYFTDEELIEQIFGTGDCEIVKREYTKEDDEIDYAAEELLTFRDDLIYAKVVEVEEYGLTIVRHIFSDGINKKPFLHINIERKGFEYIENEHFLSNIGVTYGEMISRYGKTVSDVKTEWENSHYVLLEDGPLTYMEYYNKYGDIDNDFGSHSRITFISKGENWDDPNASGINEITYVLENFLYLKTDRYDEIPERRCGTFNSISTVYVYEDASEESDLSEIRISLEFLPESFDTDIVSDVKERASDWFDEIMTAPQTGFATVAYAAVAVISAAAAVAVGKKRR